MGADFLLGTYEDLALCQLEMVTLKYGMPLVLSCMASYCTVGQLIKS